MEFQDKWYVILNPVSGNGRALKDRSVFFSLFQKYKINTEFSTSNYPGHAIELVKNAISEGYRKFIGVGGDGTLNEIVNGIFLQQKISGSQFTLAAIPVGTGNDWAKNNGLIHRYEQNIRMIAENISYSHDIGILNYFENSAQKRRYFLNFAGNGFDSAVLEKITTKKFGRLSYLIAILKTFLFYRGIQMEISIEGKLLKRRVFAFLVGLGKYVGGGMYLAPHSIPDDGYFDVTLVNSLSKFHLLISLPYLYNGKINNHSRVETFRCKNLKIVSADDCRVEADGELLGFPPVSYQISQKSLLVIGDFHKRSAFSKNKT